MQQRVKVNDVFSNWIQLVGGTPRGSWLVPLILLLIIDDLQLDWLFSSQVAYVDDTIGLLCRSSWPVETMKVKWCNTLNLRTWSQAIKVMHKPEQESRAVAKMTAQCAIYSLYGCSEKFWESLATPTANFRYNPVNAYKIWSSYLYPLLRY